MSEKHGSLIEFIEVKSKEHLEEKAKEVKVAMQNELPSRGAKGHPYATGNLKSAVIIQDVSPYSKFVGVLSSRVPYVNIYNDGRGAVTAKYAPYLVFMSSYGHIVRKKSVKKYTGKQFVQNTVAKFR